MEEIEITPTSDKSALISAIPLRVSDNDMTRLVFQAELVENIHDDAAPVRGRLIHQRKRKSNEWEPVEAIQLSTLKAGEGVRLELGATASKRLFEELGRLYELYSTDGIPFATTRYVAAGPGDVVKPQIEYEPDELLAENSEAVGHFLRWLSERSESDLAQRLRTSEVQNLLNFDAALGAARLQQFLANFDEYSERAASEPELQQLFRENAWVLSQLFAAPVVLIQNQPYVGGKRVDNRGGNVGDYLYASALTLNALVVEIKRPDSRLFPDKAYRDTEYRNNVTGVSEELAAASVQALSNRTRLIEHFRSLLDPEAPLPYRVSSPRALLLVGTLAGATPSMISAFEVYRSNSRDLDIVTFDELRAKVTQMLALLGAEPPGGNSA